MADCALYYIISNQYGTSVPYHCNTGSLHFTTEKDISLCTFHYSLYALDVWLFLHPVLLNTMADCALYYIISNQYGTSVPYHCNMGSLHFTTEKDISLCTFHYCLYALDVWLFLHPVLLNTMADCALYYIISNQYGTSVPYHCNTGSLHFTTEKDISLCTFHYCLYAIDVWLFLPPVLLNTMADCALYYIIFNQYGTSVPYDCNKGSLHFTTEKDISLCTFHYCLYALDVWLFLHPVLLNAMADCALYYIISNQYGSVPYHCNTGSLHFTTEKDISLCTFHYCLYALDVWLFLHPVLLNTIADCALYYVISNQYGTSVPYHCNMGSLHFTTEKDISFCTFHYCLYALDVWLFLPPVLLNTMAEFALYYIISNQYGTSVPYHCNAGSLHFTTEKDISLCTFHYCLYALDVWLFLHPVLLNTMADCALYYIISNQYGTSVPYHCNTGSLHFTTEKDISLCTFHYCLYALDVWLFLHPVLLNTMADCALYYVISNQYGTSVPYHCNMGSLHFTTEKDISLCTFHYCLYALDVWLFLHPVLLNTMADCALYYVISNQYGTSVPYHCNMGSLHFTTEKDISFCTFHYYLYALDVWLFLPPVLLNTMAEFALYYIISNQYGTSVPYHCNTGSLHFTTEKDISLSDCALYYVISNQYGTSVPYHCNMGSLHFTTEKDISFCTFHYCLYALDVWLFLPPVLLNTMAEFALYYIISNQYGTSVPYHCNAGSLHFTTEKDISLCTFHYCLYALDVWLFLHPVLLNTMADCALYYVISNQYGTSVPYHCNMGSLHFTTEKDISLCTFHYCLYDLDVWLFLHPVLLNTMADCALYYVISNQYGTSVPYHCNMGSLHFTTEKDISFCTFHYYLYALDVWLFLPPVLLNTMVEFALYYIISNQYGTSVPYHCNTGSLHFTTEKDISLCTFLYCLYAIDVWLFLPPVLLNTMAD
ncbi:hypothetical protein J6590_105950 [Homalodisca vitripennis]|nr:hypothetical protein J6590_105950 [Homalodisca vitripennis]